ncbi:hypothetical protein C8R47DRAFT_1090609 [Mycena vitilis]|nr:hypothetical protein C8R47DRAFT_1090609 [Mycena vitilis]
MTTSPRTVAIIWAVVVLFDVIAVALYTLSLVRKSDSRWYNILMIVLMSIGAIAASWNSWRWWKTYKQSRESLPYTMTGTGSSVPLVGK